MIFETARLVIRPLTIDDLEEFHDMQSNPKVMQHVGGKALSWEENRQDLQEVIEAYAKPNNTFWVWAIMSKADQVLVGTCALVFNDKGENEIGFRFREKFWGQGFGREVTEALLRYGLESMHLGSIVAYVDKENIASVKILEKCMNFNQEFYNEQEKCVDRKYIIATASAK